MTEEEERLFAEFVRIRKADNRSPESAPVEGISSRTLRRYIVDNEVPSRLEDDTRLAMARFVASRGVAGYEHILQGTARKPAALYLDGDALAEMYRRIDLIESSDAPEWVKVLRMDSLAATIRAEAMRQAEVASAERASAIRQAEDAARERASTAGREAEGANQRAVALMRTQDDAATVPAAPVVSVTGVDPKSGLEKGLG